MEELFENELDAFTMSSLQACCNALGSNEKHGYVKEADCIESVRELIKRLRNDTDTCVVRRYIGAAQIVQRDLIPILKTYSHETALFDIVVRLLINLTQPPDACFDLAAVKTDVHLQKCFLEVRVHLGTYKRAFGDSKFFECLAQRCARLLSVEWTTRQADDRLLIERILILASNILRIEAALDAASSSLDAKWTTSNDNASWSVAQHAHVCSALLHGGFGDILLYIASNEDDFSAHILELIQLTLRFECANDLASRYEQLISVKSAQSGSSSGRAPASASTPAPAQAQAPAKAPAPAPAPKVDTESSELRSILEREQFAKRAARFANGARSRLSGTFTVKNLNAPAVAPNPLDVTSIAAAAATPAKPMIVHAPLERFVAHTQTGSFLFDSMKKRRRQPKNRLAADCDEAATDRLAQRATESLYRTEDEHVRVVGAFCVEVLESAFNSLIRNAMHAVQADARGPQAVHDEQACFWAIRFFVEFVVAYKRCALIDCIGEALRVDTFHVLLTRIERYAESRNLDRANTRLWTTRQNGALRAYRTLISCLGCLIQRSHSSRDSAETDSMRRSAKTLFSRLAYAAEHRDLVLRLLRDFNVAKHSRAYLFELIEMGHEFLKLLEAFVSEREREGSMLVQVNGRQRLLKSGAKKKEKAKETIKRMKWLSIESALRSEFAERTNEEAAPADCPPPFDATVAIEASKQPKLALCRLQSLLRHAPRAALALYRRARDAYPVEFGPVPETESPSLTGPISETEVGALVQIWMADLHSAREELRTDLGEVANDDDSDPLNKILREDAVRFGDADADANIIDDDASDSDDADADQASRSGSDDDDAERREAAFNMREFMEGFANQSVLHALFYLLDTFERNPATANHAALRILGRLAFGMPQQSKPTGDAPLQASTGDTLVGALFQIGFFRTMHRAFTPVALRERRFDEFRDFSRRILRRFADATRQNPKLFVEVLFYRAPQISREVVTGVYADQPVGAAKRQSKWTDTLESELHDLFIRLRVERSAGFDEQAFEEPEGEDQGDIVDRIMKSLSDHSKTRRQIVKKLLMMRLVTSVDELGLRRAVSSKRKPEWSDAEVEELRSLFSMFSAQTDVVGAILAHATEPALQTRSARQIRSKLVEIGVADRAALRKKRGKKGENDPADDRVDFAIERELITGRLSDDDSDSSSSSEDDNELERLLERFREDADPNSRKSAPAPAPAPAPAAKAKPKQPANRSTAKQSKSQFNRKALSSVKQGAHAEALAWLASKLKANATKRRETQRSVDAALVSVSAAHDAALEDSNFRDVLISCGLQPPRDDDGQVYWRIPASLTASELEQHADLLLRDDAEASSAGLASTGDDANENENEKNDDSLAGDTNKSLEPESQLDSQGDEFLRTLLDQDASTRPSKSAVKDTVDSRPKDKPKAKASPFDFMKKKPKPQSSEKKSKAKKKDKPKDKRRSSLGSDDEIGESATQTDSLLKTLFNDDLDDESDEDDEFLVSLISKSKAKDKSRVDSLSDLRSKSKSKSKAASKTSADARQQNVSDNEAAELNDLSYGRKRKRVSAFAEDENENEVTAADTLLKETSKMAESESLVAANTPESESHQVSSPSRAIVAAKRRRVVLSDSDDD